MRAAFSLAATVVAVGLAHSQTPSSISGLRLWADASRATGATGDRVTSLSPATGPVLSGLGPIVRRKAVGQADALRFSGSEMLRSTVGVTPGSSFTSVVAFRASNVGRRMTLFQIGLVSPTGVILDSDRRLVLFSAGKSIKGSQRWAAGDTGVISLVWSGSRAELYVNGTLDAALSPGAVAPDAGVVSVGARAIGQDGFRGDLVGFAHYGRVLTAAQRRTVESYYATPTAVPLDATYVATNAVTGGNGLLPSDPLPSLASAIAARAMDGGQILVDAPLMRPLEGMVTISSEAPIAIRGLNGAKWYLKSGLTLQGGWTRDADGAYSRPYNSRVFLAAYVPTLTDSKGRPVLLSPPYAGDSLIPGGIESTGTRLRVRLPGNANPNLHKIELSHDASCLRVENGMGMLTLEDGVFRGGSQAAVQVGQPKRGGNLTAIDCVAEYAVCGFRGASQLTSLSLTRCIGRLNTNDGFSMKGYEGVKSVMRMAECEAYENQEEGASPHNETAIYADRCKFFDNGESGMMAIMQAYFEAKNSTFEHNNLRNPSELEGGVAYWESARGKLTGCTFRNNLGAGYYRMARSYVAISGNTSVGNGKADR